MENNILLKQATKITHNYPANLDPGDTIDFVDGQSYCTNDVYLKSFGKVWVSPHSVIYKNGVVVKETLVSQSYKNYYQSRHLIKKILTSKKIVLNDKKKYLLITDNWSMGHFHWLCEVLPRLLCIKSNIKNYTLLLPDTDYTRKIGLESLRMLGISFEDVIWMKEDCFYKVKDLDYVSPIAASGCMHKELMLQIRDKFVKSGEKGNKHIYISRNKASHRKLLNEAALIEQLQHYGFEILHTEDLSLPEQITLFSSSNVLLSIHGAGLTNCIFMQEGSTVIELKRKENGPANVGYWHLADALNHHYFYYNGIPDSALPLVGSGSNLTIDITDFEKNILNQINTSVGFS